MKPSDNRFFLWLMLSGTLALANPVAAFDPDSEDPVRVSADSARLDDSAGIATYTGAVELTQGAARLNAERVVLYRDTQGLSRIEATGDPARYSQPAADANAQTEARAQSITWSAADNRLTFERQAVIEQGANSFRGDTIHYDTKRRVVTAEGGNPSEDRSGRVEMVIQPRSNASDSNNGQVRDGSSQGQ